MTELVAMATRAQENIDRLTDELATARRNCELYYHERNAANDRIALLESDMRAHGLNAGAGVGSNTVAALRSAVIAIMAPENDKEKWLEGAGWQRTRDAGWRESHLSGTVPFATACDIEIRKQLGPFIFLRNDPSAAGEPGDAR